MMALRKDEKGVSPVIGVILMVAITVILAAVIASFVFGLGGTIKPVKTPGFSVTRVNSTHVEIVLTSLGGASDVSSCKTGDGTSLSETDDGWSVGEVVTISANAPAHLIITCKVDGIEQVVLDTRV